MALNLLIIVARVQLIPMKSQKKQASSYRPIVIMSQINKVLERIIISDIFSDISHDHLMDLYVAAEEK